LVADDDLLDAFAALWTAERISNGTARTVPAAPLEDRFGLRMEMVT
jgi:predicted RNase H-like nuclease